MTAWIALALLLPLILAAALFGPSAPWALRLTPLAALPTAILVAAPATRLEVPWLLLGAVFEIDHTARVFLLLVVVVFTVAGYFAWAYHRDDPARRRFALFFLLTLAGTVGAVLAVDAAGYYLFYGLMTFAAYGLVVHDGTGESRRAGRVYLSIAVLGEAALLAAVLLLAARVGDAPLGGGATLAAGPYADLAAVLVAIAFALKMGTVPLHVWLPLAHPAAPAAASAVLSGVLVKLGLLGWLRFLPFDGSLAFLSGPFVLAGLVSAFYGALIGVLQRRPKTVLAYSTVSQMGLATMLVGAAFSAPAAGALVEVALLVFVLHHGLAKSALFLGAGLAGRLAGASAGRRRLLLGAVAVPAAALAGLPVTSGALAKGLLKSAAAAGGTFAWLPDALWISSVATTLLMARFLYVVRPSARRACAARLGDAGPSPERLADAGRTHAGGPPSAGHAHPPRPGLWAAFLAAAVLVLALPLVLLTGAVRDVGALDPAYLWSAPWPVLLGAAVAAVFLLRPVRARLRPVRILRVPEGDVVVLFEAAFRGARAVLLRLGAVRMPRLPRPTGAAAGLPGLEARLQDPAVAGVLFLAAAAGLWWLLG